MVTDATDLIGAHLRIAVTDHEIGLDPIADRKNLLDQIVVVGGSDCRNHRLVEDALRTVVSRIEHHDVGAELIEHGHHIGAGRRRAVGILADAGLLVGRLRVVIHAAQWIVEQQAFERLLQVAPQRVPRWREVEVGIDHLHRPDFGIDGVRSNSLGAFQFSGVNRPELIHGCIPCLLYGATTCIAHRPHIITASPL